MNKVAQELRILLADTYALYLKTQNYHWHVKGPHFKPLHELFEVQYQALALAVDEIAERILTLGEDAPATFRELSSLARIQEGQAHQDANQMLSELAKDHKQLIQDLNTALRVAQECHDEGTATLMGDRIVEHEKTRWMLTSSLG
jgi:starvation-inducible DNA-binding protein